MTDSTHHFDAPGSDLRYFVTTARSLSSFDLSAFPQSSLWALVEFEELVRLVQAPMRPPTPPPSAEG